MKKLLICGERSYVASGLISKLEKEGIEYDCFSRGPLKRDKNSVSGDIQTMSSNPYLDTYDTVINFIIIKDKSIEENIAYIKELLRFCELKKVKHFIQISSISVYANDIHYVNESTNIESDYTLKGGYASIKVAVDHYIDQHTIPGLQISFVRPGFVYTKSHEILKDGITKPFLGFNFLYGDKHTTLPLINRSILQDALIKIIQTENKEHVYLVLNKDYKSGTKYNFARNQWGGIIIPIPRFPVIQIAQAAQRIGLLRPSLYSKVLGLFKNTRFDSSFSENVLGLTFGKKQFCVMGSGAYGSYICNLLHEKFPHEEIYLYEVGNEKLQNESGIGYLSKIKSQYTGLQKGRYFGYGGASVKWGGQLFTFSENDFENPSHFLSDIVEVNKKWKDKVFSRFKLSNNFTESRISDSLFTKTGIWLGYFNRDLFKYFRISHNKHIQLLPNRRIVKLLWESDKITGIEFLYNGKRQIRSYDHYFLATGAFESGRILMNSGLTKSSCIPFSDHMSQRVFKIKSGTKIGNTDFSFRVKETSLITKRMVGEMDGVSFFCHPIYNSEFPFFQNFKTLLFGHVFNLNLIKNIILDIPSCFAFALYFFICKKMFVYNNEFYLQIDIENPFNSGTMKLIDDKDRYGERGVEIDFIVDHKTEALFSKAKSLIREYLDANKVIYEEIKEETQVEKYEDTYHPFGIYSDFNSINDYFHRFENLLITNTGILPRAGGINSTCAVMPLIEEYIETEME